MSAKLVIPDFAGVTVLWIFTAKTLTLQEVKADYENAGLEDFELFWDNKPLSILYKAGLLQL